ncbi:MAG: SDR family oxidoreductase [Anaerolineales bacterium]
MRALVTGGAGFIGSHLVSRLVEDDHEVLVLDDFSTGSRENLLSTKELAKQREKPAGERVEILEGRIQDEQIVQSAVKGVEVIFHQAAMVSVPGSIEHPTDCYEANFNGSLNVLAAAKEFGAKRVVLASSAAVYGNSNAPVEESAMKIPLSPYAASKLAMEEAALMFQRVYDLPVVCLRYFNVYGPRQRPDSPYAAVIPAFIRAMHAGKAPTIFGDGEQKRDFIHVGDVVHANLLAAESDDAVGRVLNISGGAAITVNELAGILQDFMPGAPAPIYLPPREGDIYFSEAVIERAWQALGYRPKVALVEGLQSTVEWFRQERLQTPQ